MAARVAAPGRPPVLLPHQMLSCQRAGGTAKPPQDGARRVTGARSPRRAYVPISRRLAHHWGLNGAGKSPTGAPLPRWARVVQQGVWVIGFGITAIFVAVAISAALGGRWL